MSCTHDDFRLYGDEQVGHATCKHCGKTIDFCDAVNRKMELFNELIEKIKMNESPKYDVSPPTIAGE